VGLTLVMNALGSEIHALRISRNYVHASILLEEKLAEIEKKGEIDLINEWKGGKRGKFNGDYEKFEWSIEVSPIENTDLVKVKITVGWREVLAGGKRELVAITYLPKK
ncbi:MAG: hypothetical protein NC834_06170, partial [Candidatus Omnitrophica bacterium]|nr:hypothetical protein [Candidatus Omnitrophota bacterium]